MSHPLVGRITFGPRRTEKSRVLGEPYKLDDDPYVEFGSKAGLWGYANAMREGSKPCPMFEPHPEMEAMQIVLELLRRGLARFEVSPNGFSEFYFNGIRYCVHTDDSYAGLVATIGLKELRALLEVK